MLCPSYIQCIIIRIYVFSSILNSYKWFFSYLAEDIFSGLFLILILCELLWDNIKEKKTKNIPMRIYFELVYMTVLAARNEYCLAVKSSGMIFRLHSALHICPCNLNEKKVLRHIKYLFKWIQINGIYMKIWKRNTKWDQLYSSG